MTTRHILPAVAILASLSVFGAGCNPVASLEQKAGQKVAEGIINSATNGQVKVSGDNNTVAFKDEKTGATAVYGSDVKLPDNFPKDMPIPSNIKILVANVEGDGKSAEVTFETEKDATAFADEYGKGLTDAGWKADQTMAAGTMTIRSYTKSDIKISMTAATKQDGTTGSMVSLVRSEQTQ